MLSQNELQNLVNFQGYGNLQAPLWFIGFEESLGKRPGNAEWSPEWELKIRATWPKVIDVRNAHEQLKAPYWNRRNYSQVWKVMAQLARGILQQAPDWMNTDLGHQYVINNLGREHGETFLGETLPLPASSMSHWPYTELFSNRDEYVHVIWPKKKLMWAHLVMQHEPKIVICYGKGPGGTWWGRYKEIFQGLSWRPLEDNRLYSAQFQKKTRVYLTPFFGQGQYRKTDLAAIIRDIGEL